MSTIEELGQYVGGYLAIADIKEPVVATIIRAEPEEISGEMKGVLTFAELKKKLVINGSRHKQLKGLFGEKETPVGKKVTLVVKPYEVRGRPMTQICIEAAQ